MRQRGSPSLISRYCAPVQGLELDKKMRERNSRGTNLFQANNRTKAALCRMPKYLAPEICRCNAGEPLLLPSFFQNATSIENLKRNRSPQFC